MKKILKRFTSVFAAFAITAMCLPCMPAVTVEAATATLKQTNIMSDHDPGFEKGTFTKDGILWNASGSVACSTEQKHSGSYSLKSTDKQVYSGPQAILNNLTVGAKYYVSVWVYTADSGLKAKIGQMDNTGSGGSSRYEANKSLTAGGWTQLAATIEAKYTSIKLVINFDTGTRTTPVYFDDFEVIPISVAGNLVANPGFEVGTNASWTAKDYWSVVPNPISDSNTGKYVAEATKQSTQSYPTSRTPQQTVTITPDTYYYISAAVAQAKASAKADAVIMRLQQSAPSGATKITIPSNYTAINTTSYTDAKAVVYNKDATAAAVYVQTGESAGYPGVYVDNFVVAPIEIKSYTEGGAGIISNGDITLTVPEDIEVTTSSITIDNGAKVTGVERSGRDCVVSFSGMKDNTTYKLGLNTGLNLSPSWSFTTGGYTNVLSPLNGAEKVSVNTDLKLVFTEEVNGVSASNIEISGATVGTITASTDKKTYTVDLGTLSTNTTYNAKVTGVVDKNGNTVADTTFTFTTAHAGYENILVTQGYDVGFETSLDNYNLKGTVERTNAKKHTGAYSALSTARTGGYFGARPQVNLEENTEYLMSAWVYTETTGEAIQMRLQGADVGAIGDFKGITAGQWNHVTAITNTSSDQAVVTGAYFYPQTNTNNDIWVDDYELVKIGKLPSSDKYAFDNSVKKVTLKKAYTDKYDSMVDIVDDIIGASDYDISVNDKDGSGDWTTGDELILTSITAGADYKKVYSVDVRNYYDSSTEALIVKGSDGIGDDFSHSDKITKSGNAFIEYRVENNDQGAVTPAVVAAVYDEAGRLLEFDVDDTKTIAKGQYVDFELEAKIPADSEGAVLKLMVWDSLVSMKPLMPAKVYTIDTNNFTIPTVISNGMVLQRNADTVIYGTAPAGALVTAELSGGIKGEYRVPAGDSEFFVKLPMGEYSTEEQTLTITATDKTGESLGSFTRTGVLVGDVYYGSGQSNMARQFNKTAEAIQSGSSTLYTPDQYDSYVDEYKKLGDTLSTQNVRFFKNMTEGTTKSRSSWDAEALAAKEVWKKIDRNSIDEMYQVMVRMAAEIKSIDEYKDVPIGILCCAQGGTIAAKWVSRDTFFSAGFEEEYDNYEKNVTRADASTYWASHTDLYYDGARSVLPYTVKAAVWYQGQSDASSNYDKYLTGVIHDIRESQKNDMLPVLVLGLFGSRDVPNTKLWPVQRLGQLNVANQLTNVYTTITNDTGDPTASDPYHPANDADVAIRAARSMLANVYSEDIAWRGPVYAGATYGIGSASITINTNGGTLGKYTTTVGSPIFELTTDGGATWKSANSIAVDGNTVTVSNSSITGTVNGVRYAMTPVTVKCIYGTYTDALGANVTLPLVPFDTTYVPNTLSYK